MPTAFGVACPVALSMQAIVVRAQFVGTDSVTVYGVVGSGATERGRRLAARQGRGDGAREPEAGGGVVGERARTLRHLGDLDGRLFVFVNVQVTLAPAVSVTVAVRVAVLPVPPVVHVRPVSTQAGLSSVSVTS